MTAIATFVEWFLRTELRAVREETGWSQRRLGDALRMHANSVHKWEKGDHVPKPASVARVCAILGVQPKRAAFLLHVAEMYYDTKLISDYGDRSIYILERADVTYGELWKWDPHHIPGLLQTEAYHVDFLPGPIQGEAVRIPNWKRKEERQARYRSRATPALSKFLIGEAAMNYLRGMRPDQREEQFERLLQEDSMPNTEVRVIEGLHRGVMSCFDCFWPSGVRQAGPPFIYVETIDQARHIVEADALAMYDQIFREMWASAKRIGEYLDEQSQHTAYEYSQWR
jgi:transcriptional regulator with XRE-family HTH domain